MVSERRAIEPERTTTTICTRAVAKSPTNDHFTAQMPRSEVAMEGSTAPWVCPCPPGHHGLHARVPCQQFYRRSGVKHPSACKAYPANFVLKLSEKSRRCRSDPFSDSFKETV